MGDLSTNFNRREFACKGSSCCGGSAPIQPNLVQALQELRELIGKPIAITSGFRCVTHNNKVNGAKTSQHLYGTAADISVSGVSPEKVAEYAEQVELFREGGIGIYKNFTHVDVRNNIARWRG